MKKSNNTYQVAYTQKIGGTGTILVAANDERQAIARAKNACFTGYGFCNPILTDKEYVKTTNQGFAGSNRM